MRTKQYLKRNNLKRFASGFDPKKTVPDFYVSPFIVNTTKCLKYNALNFGHGAPDFETSKMLIDSTEKASKSLQTEGDNVSFTQKFFNEQLAISKGKMMGYDLDPNTEVLATVGGTGALTAFVGAHLKPGDRVVLLDPFFIWHPVLYNAGLKVKYSESTYTRSEEGGALKPELDFDHLNSIIDDETKALILINPNNPDGRVWSREEIDRLADIVRKNKNLKVFSDEIYNRHIFDDTEFIPFASVPEMKERTVTGYSFGKEFACTGWRVGAAVGDKKLMEPIKKYAECSVGDISILSTLAVAHALEAAED